jgi:phage replication O-like protein O
MATKGFEKQTYTQVPNSLFEIMHEMDECELKVVLYICRYTFGYHRDEVKISTRKLAEAIGMNTASVAKGGDAAVKRGLIEKVTDGQNTTIWRALVSDSKNESPVSDSESDTRVIQKVIRVDSDNESQVGVKESKDSSKEKANALIQDLSLENQIFLGKIKAQLSRTDQIKNALRDHFKLTPRWSSKFDREWLEWALSENMTAEQIKTAAQLWGSDKRFNWTVPTLKGIAEHWLELIGSGFMPQQQASTGPKAHRL